MLSRQKTPPAVLVEQNEAEARRSSSICNQHWACESQQHPSVLVTRKSLPAPLCSGHYPPGRFSCTLVTVESSHAGRRVCNCCGSAQAGRRLLGRVRVLPQRPCSGLRAGRGAGVPHGARRAPQPLKGRPALWCVSASAAFRIIRYWGPQPCQTNMLPDSATSTRASCCSQLSSRCFQCCWHHLVRHAFVAPYSSAGLPQR